MKQHFYALLLILIGCLAAPAGAQVASDVVVPITVAAQADPAQVELLWPASTAANITLVGRKRIFDTDWILLAQLPGNVPTFTDKDVSRGDAYEYIVLRQGPPQAVGLAYVGLDVAPVTSSRGRFILVVDNSLSPFLSAELARFEADLRGDGWQVLRHDVSPTASTVASVKALLRADYQADPDNTVAALLFGNLPVPYSGNINPDGHGDHLGAWPTDYYYGDMDEAAWTDNTVNSKASARPANHNTPGDGKFDQSQTPTLAEIVVSRVDFTNLQGWNVPQEELYRRYLNKNHAFRTGAYKPENQTLVDDNFGYFSGEAFAQNGWRNGAALTGSANVRAGDFFGDTGSESFLIGYGCGPGTYTSAGGVGTSDDFKTDSVNATFAMLFGSYFGDWGYENNPLMPSALASKGGILTCTWAGRPNWHLHHMSMGQPILVSTFWTWLNSFLSVPAYPPNFGDDLIHVGLLGDPTLRAHAVVPPTDVVARSSCSEIELEWQGSQDATHGYMVYRAAAADGAFELLTADPIVEPFFVDEDPLVGENFYQIKALKLEEVPTGTYFNQSIGIGASAMFSGQVFTATAQPTAGVCGGNGGSIDLMVSGSANFQYLWSNGATTQDISGLAAGTYSVTVTDGVGCSATASATVTVQPEPTAGINVVRPIRCNGDTDGFLSATATGGTAPYTGKWSNGATGTNIAGLVPGTYTVTITDANGCTDVASMTLVEPPVLVAGSEAQGVLCNGGETGGVTATITGGTTPYSYNWSTGAATQNISNLPAGNYSLTVTDANGCTKTTSATVNEPSAPVSLQTSSQPASCNGGTNGRVNLTVNGGVGGYSFVWSTGATTQNLPFVGAGVYSVTATDANGCSATAQATVNENSTLAVSGSVAPAVCFGFFTGSIELDIIGGTPSYNVEWSNGETSNIIEGLQAGTYTASVTDANNCEFIATFEVTQPAEITGEIQVLEPISCALSSDGLFSINAAGGVPPFTYEWGNGSTGQTISGGSGTYRVTVTDATGCTNSFDSQVAAPEVLRANTVSTSESCAGASDGSASCTPTGGTQPYTYLWSNGATSAQITGVPNGTYTVTVTDANGCTVPSTVFVTGGTAPQYSALAFSVSCFGEATGRILGSAALGTPPYSYSWSNGATTEGLSNLAAGTYTVTTTDSKGCTDVASYTIDQPATGVSLSNQVVVNASCFGSTDGRISVSAAGGTAPYEYTWSNGETGDVVGGLSAGVYTVTITDNLGCTFVPSIFIVTQPAPITAFITGSDTACVDVAASFALAGNFTNHTWSASGNGTVLTGQGTGNATIRWAASGANTVTVNFSDSDGCPGAATFSVFVDVCIGTSEVIWAGVQVSPNPFADRVDVIFENAEHTGATLRLSDLNGRLIVEKTVETSKMRLETGDLPPGAYLLQLIENGQIAARKLLKM